MGYSIFYGKRTVKIENKEKTQGILLASLSSVVCVYAIYFICNYLRG